MSTIALRIPTVEADAGNGQDFRVVAGGHCYMLFSEPRITVRELVTEKVKAEVRKAHAGGIHTASLDRLTGHGHPTFDGPLDEQLLVANAHKMFREGTWTLLVDGHTCLSLDEQIELTRRTCIQFVVREKNLEAKV